MNANDPTQPREVFLDKAKTSLAEVIASLQLDPGDGEKFVDEIREVESMMHKLDRGVIHIAAFGMAFALARLYGISMTRVGVGKLVIEIGKMAGLFTATEVGTHFLIGVAKGFFAATTFLTGGATAAAYASVAPIQAFAAGYGSRVIGEATKVYLRNGASWGPAGPRTVVRHILDSLDRESIMARIRDELRSRLHTS